MLTSYVLLILHFCVGSRFCKTHFQKNRISTCAVVDTTNHFNYTPSVFQKLL